MIALVAIVVLAAVANWWSRVSGHRRTEWVTKPLVTGGLLVIALVVDATDDTQRWWFVAALALCLVGDVALMLPRERFVEGLAAFLLGHVAFVIGMLVNTARPAWGATLVTALVLGATLIWAATTLRPAVVRDHARLRAPVAAYVAVIAAMAVVALVAGQTRGALAASSFVVSDAVLADNRFVAARRWSPLVVMVTYHGALAGFVWRLTA